MKTLRIYVDTSVFGGCFDEEFQEESRMLFEEIKRGKFRLVISSMTIDELTEAPEHVQKVLTELLPEHIEMIEFSNEIGELRDEYLKTVLGPAHRADAEHIASASVAEVDLVVSWNFKQIVHYDKIAGFHAVNLLKGYKPVNIYSPKEVVEK